MKPTLTKGIAATFDDIQKRITGRFAMWPMDAACWWSINKITAGDVLEIGTAFGGSAILARLAKGETDEYIYSVDPLDGFYGRGKPDIMAGMFPTRAIVEGNFEKFKVSGIELIQKMTPPLPEELKGKQFIAVLIDGNHSGTGPIDDWKCIKDSVLPGGYLMMHDPHKDAVRNAWNIIKKTPKWDVVREYIKPGHGMPSQAKVFGNEQYGSHCVIRKAE